MKDKQTPTSLPTTRDHDNGPADVPLPRLTLPTKITCTAAKAADAANTSGRVALFMKANVEEKTVVNITISPNLQFILGMNLRMTIGMVVRRLARIVAILLPVEIIASEEL